MRSHHHEIIGGPLVKLLLLCSLTRYQAKGDRLPAFLVVLDEAMQSSAVCVFHDDLQRVPFKPAVSVSNHRRSPKMLRVKRVTLHNWMT